MLKPLSVAATLLFGLGVAAGSASAQEIVDAADPTRLMQVALDYGSARVEVDGVGDPVIRGELADGTAYSVYF